MDSPCMSLHRVLFMHYFNPNPDYVWRSIVLNYQRSSKFGLKIYKNFKIFKKKALETHETFSLTGQTS